MKPGSICKICKERLVRIGINRGGVIEDVLLHKPHTDTVNILTKMEDSAFSDFKLSQGGL